MQKAFLSALIPAFFFFTACTAQNHPNQAIGGDRDAHGCIGSAGYVWSALKGDCIRLFEDGIRLNPQDKSLDQTTSAFIVFKSPDEDAQAELFLPGQPAVLLPRVGKNDAGTWKNKKWVLKQWRGMYSLEDRKGKLLYQGNGGM